MAGEDNKAPSVNIGGGVGGDANVAGGDIDLSKSSGGDLQDSKSAVQGSKKKAASDTIAITAMNWIKRMLGMG